MTLEVKPAVQFLLRDKLTQNCVLNCSPVGIFGVDHRTSPLQSVVRDCGRRAPCRPERLLRKRYPPSIDGYLRWVVERKQDAVDVHERSWLHHPNRLHWTLPLNHYSEVCIQVHNQGAVLYFNIMNILVLPTLTSGCVECTCVTWWLTQNQIVCKI